MAASENPCPRRDEDDKPDNACVNELLADNVQKEVWFKVRRLPENLVVRFQVVNVVLLALELGLIISNNFDSPNFWASFVATSTRYREAIKRTRFVHAIYPTSLDRYHLWRGWIVPGTLAGGGYIAVALLCLRHELYHWKPDLLQHYFDKMEASTLNRWIPRSWLAHCFRVYERKHKA